MANGEVPGWVKAIVYVGVPLGVLVGGYYIVKNLVVGGGQAFLDTYQKQLSAYITKMDNYAKQGNGALSPAQEASRQDEVALMKNTQANAAQAFNNPWQVIGLIGGIGAAVLILWALPQIISKWKPIFQSSSTTPKSAAGVAKMMECVIVDQLAQTGYMATATNFLSTLQNTWNTVDVPQLQLEMASLQSQIDAGILTGIELSLAQATILAYGSDIAVMPSIFAIPLV